jgi:hypothetical protein
MSKDFINNLASSEECDETRVIVDRFWKISHFIPLKKMAKYDQHLAKIFARHI